MTIDIFIGSVREPDSYHFDARADSSSCVKVIAPDDCRIENDRLVFRTQKYSAFDVLVFAKASHLGFSLVRALQ